MVRDSVGTRAGAADRAIRLSREPEATIRPENEATIRPENDGEARWDGRVSR